MTVPLDKIKALNYDHHRRMGEIHMRNLAEGRAQSSANVDDESYRSLLRFVPKEKRDLLELGSASGGQWTLLHEWCAGGRISGVDLYEPLVAQAQERGLDIRLGFVEELPFSDTSFDLVCSRHVMEHLGDVDAGIQQIKRVLRIGGISAHVTSDMKEDPEPAHLNKWSLRMWEDKWVEHGFLLVHAERREYHGGEVHVVARRTPDENLL